MSTLSSDHHAAGARIRRLARTASMIGLAAVVLGPASLSGVAAGAAVDAKTAAPSNNGFTRASPVPISGALVGSTSGAGTQPGEPNAGPSERTVWFTWTPSKPGQAFILKAARGAPVRVRAYTGTRLTTLVRADVPPSSGTQALAVIDAFAGVTYAIQVESKGRGGHFRLSILQPAAGAPANDALKSALSLAALAQQSEMHPGARVTLEGTTAGAASPSRNVGPAVWYRFIAPLGASGTLRVTLADVVPAAHLRLTVFSGRRLRQVGSSGADESLTVVAGHTYAIRVSGASAYFTLGVSSSGAAVGQTAGPRITCPEPAPRWYDHNLTVPCHVRDRTRLAGSARASFSLETSVPAGTATAYAHTDTVRVCDRQGRCATAGPIDDLEIDRAPPVVTCGTPPSGTFDTSVSLPCSAYDPPGGSGLREPADRSFTVTATIPADTEGARTVTFRHAPVCDRAGNCTNLPALKPVRIELSAPTVHCDAAPAGWVSQNVTLHCSADDSGSGLDAPGDARFTLTTSVVAGVSDADAYTGARAVCNRAGSCVKVGPFGPIRVAREIPTVTCHAPVGWHRGTHASVTCTARAHGPELVDGADARFSLGVTIGAGRQAIRRSGTRRVCDAAGNCAVAGPFTVELDDSPPRVSCPGTPRGWFSRPVTDTCTVTDAGSGVPLKRQVIELTASLPAGRVSASVPIPRRRVCDNVGNCTLTPRLKPARIDRQLPVVTCARPTAGVHTQNVTVSCEAADGRGPGLADAADRWFTLSTDIAPGRSSSDAFTGTHVVCDQAGNCTQAGHLGPVSVNLTGANGGLKAVPTIEQVLAAQPRPTTPTADDVQVAYAEPGSISDSGPGGVCSPGPGAPLRFGESTVVCGVFTPHGLKTRPIEIDVTAAPGLEPRGSARAGASWRVVGEDFRRHSHVMITLDGVSLATTSATQGGTVSASIMLPPGLTAGVHHLALTGRNPQGQPLIVATSLTVSYGKDAGPDRAPKPIGPVTPITALSLTGSGRLVAPNGTRSFDSAPHHGDTTTTSTT